MRNRKRKAFNNFITYCSSVVLQYTESYLKCCIATVLCIIQHSTSVESAFCHNSMPQKLDTISCHNPMSLHHTTSYTITITLMSHLRSKFIYLMNNEDQTMMVT